MKKEISWWVVLFILIFSFSSFKWRTGPSNISSEMIPVSINTKGEILCKTRFYQNPSGAHSFMPVHYGACVIANGNIIQYEGKVLDPDEIGSGSDAYALMRHYDSLFEMNTTLEQFTALVKLVKGPYSFDRRNAHLFEVDQKMTISQFERKEGVDVNKTPQMALNGAKTETYSRSTHVQVLYNFGKVIFLKNEIGDDYIIGGEFDYRSYERVNSEGKTLSYDFDYCYVIGVLIKK